MTEILTAIEARLEKDRRRHFVMAGIHYVGIFSIYPIIGAAIANLPGAAAGSVAGTSWLHKRVLNAADSHGQIEALRRLRSVLERMQSSNQVGLAASLVSDELNADIINQAKIEDGDRESFEDVLSTAKRSLRETGLKTPAVAGILGSIIDLQKITLDLTRDPNELSQ